MGVISKGGIRGEKKRPGRACQHCDKMCSGYMKLEIYIYYDDAIFIVRN